MSKPISARLIGRNDQTIYLGYFEQTGESMIVGDPTYPFTGSNVPEVDVGTRVSGDIWSTTPFFLDNVMPGIYQCWSVKSNLTYQAEEDPYNVFNRLDNTAVWCIHNNYVNIFNQKWEEITQVPVDSGQAGIYDANQDYGGGDGEDQEWYDLNSSITTTDIGAGVLPSGVVSSSGGGDGIYTAYAGYDGETVIAVWIDFNDN